MSLQFGLDKIQIGQFATGSGANSIAIGTNAVASATNSICIGETLAASNYGIAIGYQAYCGTVGSITASNICIGVQCVNSTTTMATGRNIIIGFTCLFNTTTDFTNNIAIGNECIAANAAVGSYNNAIGTRALYSLITGIYNNAIGWEAGYNIIQGRHNQLMGTNAGRAITGTAGATNGYHNICIGHSAGSAITIGNHNICLGASTIATALGNHQICIGYGSESSADYAVAIGDSAKATLNAVAVGHKALCTGGTWNIALGINSAASVNYAIAIGCGPDLGGPRASGSGSIAIGYGDTIASGNYTRATNSYSVAIGRCSLSSGFASIAIGGTSTTALAANSTADYAIAIGYDSLASGSYGIAIGSGTSATSTDSIAIGTSISAGANTALYGSIAQTTHKFYTLGGTGGGKGIQFIGNSPIDLTLAINNVTKGFMWTALGAGNWWAVNADDCGINISTINRTLWFCNGAASLVCQMSWAVNKSYPDGTWGGISDKRLKTDISSVRPMLETCRALKVRKYALNDTPDKYYYGWIAQEVIPHLTEEELTKFNIIGKQPKDKNGNEFYTLGTEEILIMNFKATQELADLHDETRKKADSIKVRNDAIRESFRVLKQQNTQLRNSLNQLRACRPVGSL